MTRAVVDVGSNSLLLLVAEKKGPLWRPVYEETTVTGLGAGVKSTGFLSKESMEHSLKVLEHYKEVSEKFHANLFYPAATMAVRIAKNQQEFLDLAQAQGTPVHVLSGDSEAELGFRAVANDPLLQNENTISVIDPGGNSTELRTANRKAQPGWEVLFSKSFPVGALGLRDDLGNAESLNPLQILQASSAIDKILGMEYRPHSCGTAVSLGATGVNLVSIREKFTQWEPDRIHGAKLEYEEVSRAAGWLCSMTDAERAQIVGIEPGRERTLHLGALILERFMFAIKAESCFVSIRGWRHALLETDMIQSVN